MPADAGLHFFEILGYGEVENSNNVTYGAEIYTNDQRRFPESKPLDKQYFARLHFLRSLNMEKLETATILHMVLNGGICTICDQRRFSRIKTSR
jgi:hypothetical protein